MNFVAIDVETATPNRNSICQIALVMVENGTVVNQYTSYVRPPQNEYSIHNIKVHGITPDKTENSPTFADIWREISPFLSDRLVVAHNASFDIDCLEKSLAHYSIYQKINNVDCTCRRSNNMSLKCLCQGYGIVLNNHHDALCDAYSCAMAYIKQLEGAYFDHSKIQKEDVIKKRFFGKKLTGDILKADLENANPKCIFYNKKIVFTGTLGTLSREDAAKLAHINGADIDTCVTKKTNFVVVGINAGPSKLEKISKLQSEGFNIMILTEDEFLKIAQK